MSGQIAAISTTSIELVAVLVGLSMVVGVVDLCRQPGWAWKAADESRVAYLILVVLLPLIGLGMYVSRARPKVVAATTGVMATAPPEAEATTTGQPNGSPAMLVAQSSITAPEAPTFSAEAITPVLVSAGRAATDEKPSATRSPGFASFEEVAALSGHSPAATPVPGPTQAKASSPEISSTFFSSGATRGLRAPRLRTKPRAADQPVPTSALGRAVAPETPGPLVPIVPSGWMPDPTGNHQFRFWDGRHWTENVANQGHQSRDAAGT